MKSFMRRAAQEDVARRDFTINGLLMRHDSGEILDYVGGQADLRAGLIRAIGDADRRFSRRQIADVTGNSLRRALWISDRRENICGD